MNERTNSYAFHPFTWGHAESPPETREPNLQQVAGEEVSGNGAYHAVTGASGVPVGVTELTCGWLEQTPPL